MADLFLQSEPPPPPPPPRPYALEVAEQALAVAEQALDLAEASAALEYALAPEPSLTSTAQIVGLGPRTLRDLCATMRDRAAQLRLPIPPLSPSAFLQAEEAPPSQPGGLLAKGPSPSPPC